MYNYIFITLSQYNKTTFLQGEEQLGMLGNNLYIIDAFFDGRFSQNYTGEKMKVGEQIFTI